ncbi:MAG: hypothetical protein COA58_13255 [Bacteroidetes bacterium]|nr:MAG: hypothetical protein COA58_13255 [Bacteroidota bacterium]
MSIRHLRDAFCVFCILLTSSFVFAQQNCYNSSDLTNEIFIFDLATGSISETITIPSNVEATGYNLGGDTIWLLDEDELYFIDLNATSPSAQAVLTSTGVDDDGLDGPYGDGIQFNDFDGIAVDTNGIIYAGNVSKSSHAIIAISPITGKVIPGFFDGDDYLPVFNNDDVRIDGLGFDPITNELYAILNTGDGDVGSDTLYKVNLTDGSTTFVSDFDVADVEGMTFDDLGQMYIVTGNTSLPTTDQDKIWRVDINSGELTELYSLSGEDNESCSCLKNAASSRIEISGYVFWDQDNSTTRNYADTGHNDYTVYLYHDLNSNGTFQIGVDTLIDSVLTNINGFYYFRIRHDAAQPNYLTISSTDDLPVGSVFTTDNIESASFTSHRQVITNLNFGYNSDVNVITGYVFEDKNVDTIFNAAVEIGTAPVKVYLFNDINSNGILNIGTDVLLDSVVTNNDGSYAITRSYVGGTDRYLITTNSVDIPSGDTLTTDNLESAIFLSSGNLDAANNFGHNSSTGPIPNTITGIAYGDIDEDAILDPEEARLLGVLVNLYKDVNNNGVIEANEPLIDSENTNGSGFYEFKVDYTSYTDSLTKKITNSHNDGEQNGSTMSRSSSDLDFGSEKVGLRFINLDIPVGAIILEAYVTVTARDNGSGGTHTSTIQGEVSSYPYPFASFDNNISNRKLTDSSTVWNIPNFVAGVSVTTPDISTVIQNIIDSSDWISGNNLVLTFNDDAGGRSAKSFDHTDGATEGPSLFIRYQNVSNTFSYIAKVDSTTGPSGSHLTTTETETAAFTSGGNIDSNNNFGFWGGSTPVPVTFLNINGHHVAPNNLITWSTATEISNSHFEIERLSSVGIFEKIGRVEGNGTSNHIIEYSFLDTDKASSLSYYRIKQVDYSGRFEYSDIVTIKLSELSETVSLYPNPARNIVHISTGENESILLLDGNGKLLNEYSTDQSGTLNINTSELPNGVYLVQLRNAHSLITKRLIITH